MAEHRPMHFSEWRRAAREQVVDHHLEADIPDEVWAAWYEQYRADWFAARKPGLSDSAWDYILLVALVVLTAGALYAVWTAAGGW